MQENGSSSSTEPCIDPQFVRYVGEAVGVPNMTAGAVQYLSDQVTRLLLQSISKAKQYSIHSRRTKMLPEDLESSLQLSRLRVPYGYIKKRGPELHATTTPNGPELYTRENFDIEVANIKENVQGKIPVKTSIRSHWLAVDGKLAIVPENVRPPKEEDDDDPLGEDNDLRAAKLLARRETAGGSVGASIAFRAAMKSITTKETVNIRLPNVEPLSVEQQQYLKIISEACVGYDDGERIGALHSLEVDTGLQPILPRFSKMVFNSVRCNIIHRCLSMLIYVVRMVRAICSNQSLKLQGVLHELIPSLISCMIGRQLCSRPETDNHWALREFANRTLIQVIKDHGFSDTKVRALKTIRRVWDDPNSTYPMLYGCLPTLSEFSDRDERVLLLERVNQLIYETSQIDFSETSSLDRVEAQKTNAFLLKFENSIKKSL
ncbi:unnamed protein product [Auanema sp. JU1783]|nr:unnamed protein product [Auanema sp. JU1783]